MKGIANVIGLLALAAIGTVGLVSAVRRWAARRLVDVPNERSSHTIPTPRGGGVGIAIVVIPAWYGALVSSGFPSSTTLLITLLLVIVAALGLCDDLWSLPAWVRFAGHCSIAVAALFLLEPWRTLWTPWNSEVSLGIASYFLTGLWIVGLLNAYNFMDGIDGIAGLQGVVAGAGWLIAGWIHGLESWAYVGAALAGSCLGFLKYNWPPARIFMGDVGSTLVGCSFALLSLISSTPETPIPSWLPWMALGFVWPFVFDAVFTFVRRSVRREKVWAAHRSHMYQRLVIAGTSHARVTLLYGFLAAGSTASVLSASANVISWLASFAFLIASAMVLLVLVTGAEQKLSKKVPDCS